MAAKKIKRKISKGQKASLKAKREKKNLNMWRQSINRIMRHTVLVSPEHWWTAVIAYGRQLPDHWTKGDFRYIGMANIVPVIRDGKTVDYKIFEHPQVTI